MSEELLMKIAVEIEKSCACGCPCSKGCVAGNDEECMDRILNWLKTEECTDTIIGWVKLGLSK